MRATAWFLTALTLLWATGAAAQCSVGTAIQQGCGQITFDGCCTGQDLFWCEGGWICYLDCSANPLCGWLATGPFYDCGTPGNPAPGNNPPMVCATGPVDQDGDGYDETQDCDDDDPYTHPGASEVCDGLDNDCSGVADDADLDGDGYDGCGGADCDDSDPSIHPGATEHCADGVDNDCDGLTDGADPACGGGDDDGSDDDASDDDGGSDDDAVDDDAGDDDGGGGGDDLGLGVMCDCRVGGTAAPPGALALGVLLIAVASRRRGR